MKLKIMIMALLLVSAGIGSAVNKLPATEFVGDVDMGGNDIIDAKLGQSSYYVTVGAYDWCDYVTDGTADDVQVMAALTDGGAGAVVRIIGYITLANESSIYPTATYQTIEGLGWMSSAIQRAEGHTGHNVIVNQTGFTIRNIGITTLGTLIGTPDYNQNGIYISGGQYTTISNVYMGGIAGSGIKVADSVGSLMGGIVTDSYMSTIKYIGIDLGDNNGDFRIINNEIGDCGERCVRVLAGSGNMQFVANHMWTSDQKAGFLFELQGDGNIIAGNFFDSPYWAAIGGAGSYNAIVGNRFWNPLVSGSKYIVFDAGANNNTVVGNIFHDSSGNMTYGVDIASGADYNTVGFNTFIGCGIADAGAGNDVAHNPGS